MYLRAQLHQLINAHFGIHQQTQLQTHPYTHKYSHIPTNTAISPQKENENCAFIMFWTKSVEFEKMISKWKNTTRVTLSVGEFSIEKKVRRTGP